MTQITISGYTFTVPAPFLPGHICTAAEAMVLNRQMHARLRRNFSDHVRNTTQPSGYGGSTSIHIALQTELNDLASLFSFDASDPVSAEALSIAISIVRKAIKDSGKRLADYSKAALTAEAEKLLAGPSSKTILPLARSRVTELQKLALEELKRAEA